MRRGSTLKIDVDKLKKEMAKRELTQVGLADLIVMDQVGVSRLISRGNCRSETLQDIEEALGLPLFSLLAPGEEANIPTNNKPRYYRMKAKLSTRDLAEKSGVSIKTINRLENGYDCYSFNAACLAQALGLPMGVYLGYED